MRSRHAQLVRAVVVVSILSAACGDSTGPGSGPESMAVLSGNGQTGVVGNALALPIIAQVLNASGGGVSGVSVTFQMTAGGGTVSPTQVVTDADGAASASWTLGTSTTETQTVRATVTDGLISSSATFTATPEADAPTALRPVAGESQTRAVGVVLRDSLGVRATDQYGNGVPDLAVDWSVLTGGGSISPASGVTGGTGVARAAWTVGSAPGPNSAQASAAGLQTVSFSATAVPAPTIESITPETLLPGDLMIITGTNFSEVAGDNTVLVDGAVAPVENATATQLDVRVPCVATGLARVRLTSNGAVVERDQALDTGTPISLGVGEAVGVDPEAAGCNELATAGGRYMVAVANGAAAVASTAAFRLRGTGSAVGAGTGAAASGRRTGALQMPGGAFPDLPLLRHRTEHLRMQRQNEQLLRELGPSAARRQRTPGTLAAQAAARTLQQNDTVSIRIPDRDTNLCTVHSTVQARVVYNGTRGIVLEDIDAPLAGQLDSMYMALGEEFDEIQFPILTANFGNPLAYEAQTDGDGKIYMLFSEAINEFGGIAGFVSTSDLFARIDCSSSNEAEIFYGVVPTNGERGFQVEGGDNPDIWYWTTRSVVAHEGKHIASFAERFARGVFGFAEEERWLEEATAMMAEELYARAHYGYAQGNNVGFEESVFCERRPDPSRHPQQCWSKPLVMLNHFFYVYQYLESIEALTPLGETSDSDGTYYGSGWAFVRWLTDHYGASEGGFLKSLVPTSVQSGAQNVAARAGRPFPELLVDFVLAMALDDRPGFTPADPVHSMPSWDLRDIYERLSNDGWTGTNPFPSEFPLSPRALTFGTFDVHIPALKGGSAVVFEVSGTGAERQLLQLTPDPGSGNLYMKVVRVE